MRCSMRLWARVACTSGGSLAISSVWNSVSAWAVRGMKIAVHLYGMVLSGVKWVKKTRVMVFWGWRGALLVWSCILVDISANKRIGWRLEVRRLIFWRAGQFYMAQSFTAVAWLLTCRTKPCPSSVVTKSSNKGLSSPSEFFQWVLYVPSKYFMMIVYNSEDY